MLNKKFELVLYMYARVFHNLTALGIHQIAYFIICADDRFSRPGENFPQYFFNNWIIATTQSSNPI